MNKPSIISYYTFIACALIIIAGVLSGKLSFGHGLGDLFYLLTLIIGGIAMTVFYLIIRRGSDNSGMALFFIVTIITSLTYYILKLTYLRGTEYPWNGNLFI